MARLSKLLRGASEQKLLRLVAEHGAAATGMARPEPDATTEDLVRACVGGYQLLSERIDAERSTAERARADQKRRLDAAAAAQAEIAKELVVIDERVRTVLAAVDGAGEADTRALVRWLRSRLDPLLETAGVVAFTEEGDFDATRHEVIETRPAPSAERAGTIASSVRPGLTLHEELLRPQLVVLYEAVSEPEAPEVSE